MLVHDELGDLGRHMFGCFAPPAHLFVVELLGDGAVLFPPCAQRVGIVRAGRADAQVRCIGGVGKLHRRVFGHTLNLQTQNLQLVHHLRHAGGHHS